MNALQNNAMPADSFLANDSSSRSRKLKLKRRYHRTQVTITSGANFRNKGGRHDLIDSPYQIRSCNTSAKQYTYNDLDCKAAIGVPPQAEE
jgi:hypothetical protein